MCPMAAYVHVMAFITIACSFDVPASLPKPCDRLYHCETRYNVRIMPVFWDDGVFHTVADILSQSHWWLTWVFHYAKILPRCIGCYIRSWKSTFCWVRQVQNVSHMQRSFYQLHLQVHTSVSVSNAIIKMPPHRVLCVDTSPEYYIVFQGVIVKPVKEV